jgi:hypothetical protein
MTKHDPAGSSPIPLVPLLITESEEEFKRIRQALYEELGPSGSSSKCTLTSSPTSSGRFCG